MYKTAFALLALLASGCVDPYIHQTSELPEVQNRIYLVDFDTAWEATLEALKSFRLEVMNRDGGYVQTGWTDNTEEYKFAERGAFSRAQYRFLVTLTKGFYKGKRSVKVSIQKEQVVQIDPLDRWKPVPHTDWVDEKTLLYRISRLIVIKNKLKALESQPAPEF